MTISVDVMQQADGGLRYVDVGEDFLFGTQSYVKRWHELALQCDLPLLARIGDGLPMYVWNDELEALDEESRRLSRQLPARVPPAFVHYLELRLERLRSAIAHARRIPGGKGSISIG